MEKFLNEDFYNQKFQKWVDTLDLYPGMLAEDFTTEQDIKMAQIYKDDPFLENTSLDFLLEEEMDKYTNELRISTFRSRKFGFPYNHPIDLLYISKPEGERFYVLYTAESFIMHSGEIIININGKTNVKLSIDDEDPLLNGKTEEEFEYNKYYYHIHNHIPTINYRCREFVSFLPISKEDFLKCCNAEHLGVRVKEINSSINYESDCDDIIPFFQMLYNRVCDNTMFAENKEKWKKQILERIEETQPPYYKRDKNIVQEKGNEKEKENNKEKLLIVAACILIPIALTLLLVLL